MQYKMDNFSREMKSIRNNQNKKLDMKIHGIQNQ